MSIKICPHCGAQLMDEEAQFCTACGNSMTDTNNNISEFNVYQPPMKWYKFLIYFALFAGAVLNFANGISYITGSVYFVQTNGDLTADMVYMVYPSLKVINIIYGIAVIGLAAMCIVTRMKLAGYKADGPKFLYITYGVGTAIGLIYALVIGITTGISVVDATLIAPIIVMIIYLFLNYKYFSKRSHMFRN